MNEKESKLGVTRAQLDNYLADGGHCLYCGSDDLDCDTFEHEAGGVYQRITCLDCRRTWTDCYHLDNVTDSEGNDLADALPVKPVEIIGTLKGGAYHGCKIPDGLPPISVTVRDYDVDGTDRETEQDEDGVRYLPITDKNYED